MIKLSDVNPNWDKYQETSLDILREKKVKYFETGLEKYDSLFKSIALINAKVREFDYLVKLMLAYNNIDTLKLKTSYNKNISDVKEFCDQNNIDLNLFLLQETSEYIKN